MKTRTHDSTRGFTMIELLVVMTIVAVMLGTGVLALQAFRDEPRGMQVSSAASVLWRGVQSYRLDHAGRLPATLEPSLVDDAGNRYVKRWPADQDDLEPVVVTMSPLSKPPASADAYAVLYHAAADRASGWLAAYDQDGLVVYQRGSWSSDQAADVVVPAG